MLTGVVTGVLTMSSRSIIVRRDIYSFAAGVEIHTARDIDPDEPPNIKLLLAFE